VEPGAELRALYPELLARDSDAGLIWAALSPAAVSPAGLSPAGASGDPGRPRPGRAGQAGARRAEARPRPAVPVPAQLPADIADFTGREDQVRRLSDLLAGAGTDGEDGAVRIALVAGAGGLGKTSLAVHAAHRVRARFPDGQLYVDLLGATAQPLAAADVLARFLRDLGVDGRDIPADPDERAARYRSSLAGRRVLVVLDNARDAAQVRPLLPGTGSSAVLVTTRSRMPDLASTRLVDLHVLDDDEALALFAKVVGDERAAAEPEATAELLEACAGLPLAIRICAARLAARSGWTIQAMANRLRDEHRRLDELKVGDLAVRASFEVSFASLPASTDKQGIDPARAFCLLGLWQGPSISSAAAAALFGVPEYSAEDALEVLVDAHLLDCESADRYRFHDLLRVYASERAVVDLSGQERAAAVERLLGWYMCSADAAATAVSPHRYNLPLDDQEASQPPAAFAGVEDALEWYDAERVNVVTATRQASAYGLHEIAWRLPASLFTMFNRRGNWADLVTTHRIALDSVRQVRTMLGEAWVLNNLGQALGRKGLKEGIDHLQQALDIRRKQGDGVGEAQAAHNLAEVQYLVNGPEVALPYLQQSLEVQRAVGHPEVHGATLNNLGEIYLELGRLNEAVECLTEAQPIFAGIGSAHGEGHVLVNLGRVYLGLGQEPDALDCLQRALAIHQAAGDRPTQALAFRFLGQAQLVAGRPDEARESLSRALAIFTELGDEPRIAETRSELAALAA
jgi:tetratricopeptide (TPR) repeat protein